jgi:hypothetical protein
MSVPQTLLDIITLEQPKIPGWCTIEKALKFVEVIVDNRLTYCIEIGVAFGSSLIPQALALQYNGEGSIFGIDDWSNETAVKDMDNNIDITWWNGINFDERYEDLIKLIKRLNLEGRCKLIKAKSEEIGPIIAGPIDMVYIDGNHYGQGPMLDVYNFATKVKKGGFICVDDMSWKCISPASKYVLEELTDEVLFNDGNWFMVRRK